MRQLLRGPRGESPPPPPFGRGVWRERTADFGGLAQREAEGEIRPGSPASRSWVAGRGRREPGGSRDRRRRGPGSRRRARPQGGGGGSRPPGAPVRGVGPPAAAGGSRGDLETAEEEVLLLGGEPVR